MRLPIAVRMPSPASKATFPAAYSLQTIEPATPLYGLSATAKAIGAGMCAYRFLSGSITKNGTFHKTAKVVNSLRVSTAGITR